MGSGSRSCRSSGRREVKGRSGLRRPGSGSLRRLTPSIGRY
jgi:hypothetical protein